MSRHRTPLLCRCVTIDGAECNRRATQEDAYCDLCRPVKILTTDGTLEIGGLTMKATSLVMSCGPIHRTIPTPTLLLDDEGVDHVVFGGGEVTSTGRTDPIP